MCFNAEIIVKIFFQNPNLKTKNIFEEYLYSSAEANLKGRSNKILSRDIIKDSRKEYIEFFKEAEADDNRQLCLIRTVTRQQKGFGRKTFIEDLKKRFRVDFEARKRGRPVKKKK